MRRPCSVLSTIVAGLLLLAGCRSLPPADDPPAAHGEMQLPGIQPDGTVRLPNQWFLRPVGKQVVVGDFPVNIALEPRGRFAAVLHCGNGQHEITVLELPGGRLVSRTALDESF